MNVSLDMPEKTGTTMAVNVGDDCTDIRPLFHKLLATETLDEDNKWFCESCKEKVIASKFSEFKSLPPALVIQLKRFRYDPVSRKEIIISLKC
jgi:ubiquitin C-terminal hydrolase